MATDLMEGTLGWRERLGIYLHLAVCEPCRRFQQQMRRTVRLVRLLPVSLPSPETEARLLAALPKAGPPPA